MAHMEDVLDLYAEPYDPQQSVVCFDETSTQLLADTRPPLLAQPGRPAWQDYEYRREGTRNLFLACEPKAGWRHVVVTERRTMQDFAHQMRWLVDEAYPGSCPVPPHHRSGFVLLGDLPDAHGLAGSGSPPSPSSSRRAAW